MVLSSSLQSLQSSQHNTTNHLSNALRRSRAAIKAIHVFAANVCNTTSISNENPLSRDLSNGRTLRTGVFLDLALVPDNKGSSTKDDNNIFQLRTNTVLENEHSENPNKDQTTITLARWIQLETYSHRLGNP